MVEETDNSPYGKARIEPEENVEAGCYTTWTITYTAGELGMDDGSTVLIVFSQTSDMGEPQFNQPIEPNYCTASTDGDAQIEAEFAPRAHIRPMKRAIRLRVHDGFLQPGETITVTLGDTEQGSPGIQAQSFPENFIFRVLVDPHATEHFAALPQDLTVDIVPGPAEHITAVMPSTAETGEQTKLRVRAEDYWGNIATGFSSTLQIPAEDGIETPEKIELEDGTGTVPVTPTDPGVYRLNVEGESFEAVSNPLECRENVEQRIFWGDIHGQSGETVGSGTVHDYFNHLKDAAFLDFGAHAANDFQITDELWRIITDAVDEFHTPGEFVTFHCYEWSANTPLGGDHNIYFRDEPELQRSCHWQVPGDTERTDGLHPVDELYDYFEGRDDVLIIPHQGGRAATLDVFDPDLTPFLEMVSAWGVFEWFAKEAYNRNYRIGVVGGSDDHSGRPGTSPAVNLDRRSVKGALMAAKSSELTRESLWDAFKSRNVYASTSARILLDVEVDGAKIGETVATETPEINVTVHGTEPITAVDLFCGTDKIASRDLTEGDDLIEIQWQGSRAKTRNKLIDWSGGAALDRGEITGGQVFGFDRPGDGIKQRKPAKLLWNAATTGDYQGIRIRVDAPDDATLHIDTDLVNTAIPLNEITRGNEHRFNTAGLNAGLTVRQVGEATQRDVELSFTDEEVPEGMHPYWIRVKQEDGEIAWSSPVFVDVEKS